MKNDFTGDGWVKGPIEAVDSPVATAVMSDIALVLTLENGTSIEIMDTAQNCCERRYPTTDDDLSAIVGAKLLRVEVKGSKDITPETDEYAGETHEVAFVDIITSKGTVTLATHNEHNGYYGGFDLQVKIIVPATTLN